MVKELNGAEIAGYMKAAQAHSVRALRAQKIIPKLVIIRDSENPVISKYVHLKQRYGADVGVEVEDWLIQDSSDGITTAIERANSDTSVHGVIVQLPLEKLNNPEYLDTILGKISPKKDVDGLNYSSGDIFDSATATAINWLLAGYDIDMAGRIAIVGRGRLVGGPLEKMWRNSGYDVTVFHRGDDLARLVDFDIIVTATGVPHLIQPEMLRSGAVVVDAGTASEGGVLLGDVSEAARARTDLLAITPRSGGVGPLTVTALFDHVITAARLN